MLYTENGEAHGLINELSNSNKGSGFEHMKSEKKKEMESRKKEDSKAVRARYINHREKQGRLQVPYSKYSGETIKIYNLIPGYTYELPLGFVNEVNEVGKMIQRKKDSENKDKSDALESKSSLQIHELVPVGF